jgi:hypothetical protein
MSRARRRLGAGVVAVVAVVVLVAGVRAIQRLP